MAGIPEPTKRKETAGETFVVPAAPGWELLTVQGETLFREPIVAWRIADDPSGNPGIYFDALPVCLTPYDRADFIRSPSGRIHAVGSQWEDEKDFRAFLSKSARG